MKQVALVLVSVAVGFALGRHKAPTVPVPEPRKALQLTSPITTVEYIDHSVPGAVPTRMRVVRWINPLEGVPPTLDGPPAGSRVVSLYDELGLSVVFVCAP